MKWESSLPDFGKSSGFYFIPGNYIIWICQMMGEAAIKLGFLRLCQRRHGIAANDVIPDGFNQLDLLVNGENFCLFQELSIHG